MHTCAHLPSLHSDIVSAEGMAVDGLRGEGLCLLVRGMAKQDLEDEEGAESDFQEALMLLSTVGLCVV